MLDGSPGAVEPGNMDPNGVVTRDVPPLTLRASFEPKTLDPEKRTVELIWTTGQRVLRGFWERYWEELSTDPKHVRMARLNNGAPLLNAHDGWDARGVLGVVESATIDGKRGTATVRFAKAEDDPDADVIFRKVRDGILQNVSVGYRVHKMEKVEDGEGKVPVMRAVDWEPYEISVVPMGADDGAGFRSTEDRTPNPCVIVTRQEQNMDPKSQTPATPPASATQPDGDVARAAAREEGAAAELARVTAIRGLVTKHKLGPDFERKLVEGKVSLEQARAAVLDELAARDEQVRTEQHVRIDAGADRRDALRAGITNALLHRANPAGHKLEEVGRQYRSMSLLRLAEECLEAVGVKARGLSPMELAGLALGVRTHTTSDFPIILADVAGKTLRAAYTEAPATYLVISRRTTLPDFKPVKRNQLGEAPELKKVLEGGEFTRGTIGEGKEQYQLATYGRVFAITRQALVNDDMDAFARMPMLFGRSARDLESDLVWAEITANANMSDGVALFHANHGNLAGVGAAISVATIGAGRAAMRKQKGINAKQFVNVAPRYLVVPAAIETVADQFVSQALLAAQSSNVNPFAGRLQTVAEPRLDANSAVAWYLAADPSQIDIIEYAYLLGEEGPVLESRVGFDVDGVELKCRHDFAAKVIDHRGLYKNPGA